MTKSSTSFNKPFLDYWVSIKGMYNQGISRVSFLRMAIMSRGNSCELKPPKNKHSFLALMSRFILVFCEPTTKYFWWNRSPVHVNMSWALGLKWFWMKQFFTKAVLSLFCSNILLQISDMAHYNHIPLLNTINVYKTSFQD